MFCCIRKQSTSIRLRVQVDLRFKGYISVNAIYSSVNCTLTKGLKGSCKYVLSHNATVLEEPIFYYKKNSQIKCANMDY